MQSPTERIWTAMSRDLDGFIRRRAGDDAAPDLLQETFVRIHDGIGQLRDEDRVAGWVYRIARNVIVDHHRRRRPGASLEDDPVADDPVADDNHNDAVGRWLMAMIASLPPDYRTAMELSEVDGLTQREVAERLGLSHSGAKSRIQRGRAMLQEMLLDCCHVDLDRYGNVVDYRRQTGCRACCSDKGLTGDRSCNRG